MSAPGRLRHRVGEIIRRHRLWEPGARVAVAVSGGVDSVVLLDVLGETVRWHGGKLSVVTVDHQIHPDGSEHADFVEALARTRGLPVQRARLALSEQASEAEARAGRYAVFEALDVDRVALAHHRDDQAETVLLQLLRGAGISGFAGMAFRRDRYVRPLLEEPRSAVRAWADHRGLSWREDPTNLTSRFSRNRVRAEVLPLLENLRPGAAKALARGARLAALDADYLDDLAAAAPQGRVDPWSSTWIASGPEALVRRVIRRRIPQAEASHLDAIVAAARGTGGTVVVGDTIVRVDGDQVWVERHTGG